MTDNVRAIMVTGPLQAILARNFARHFQDLFKPYYLYAGDYREHKRGPAFPRYVVVRIAGRNESPVPGHEIKLPREELFVTIAQSRARTRKYPLTKVAHLV